MGLSELVGGRGIFVDLDFEAFVLKFLLRDLFFGVEGYH